MSGLPVEVDSGPTVVELKLTTPQAALLASAIMVGGATAAYSKYAQEAVTECADTFLVWLLRKEET